jgi:hypothetical protein
MGSILSREGFIFLFCFFETVSLCSPGWPKIFNPPASNSQLLKIQVCTTTLSQGFTSDSNIKKPFKEGPGIEDEKLSFE